MRTKYISKVHWLNRDLDVPKKYVQALERGTDTRDTIYTRLKRNLIQKLYAPEGHREVEKIKD